MHGEIAAREAMQREMRRGRSSAARLIESGKALGAMPQCRLTVTMFQTPVRGEKPGSVVEGKFVKIDLAGRICTLCMEDHLPQALKANNLAVTVDTEGKVKDVFHRTCDIAKAAGRQ